MKKLKAYEITNVHGESLIIHSTNRFRAISAANRYFKGARIGKVKFIRVGMA